MVNGGVLEVGIGDSVRRLGLQAVFDLRTWLFVWLDLLAHFLSA